ncbi:MAG TPA: serine/threonine-protein kinase, partial [Polyangia bacterium]|nr:serine/threonine-protein kinase [Polyangia bacterium]
MVAAAVTGAAAGRYQVVQLLGSGSTALVARARDLAGGPDVALKRLRPELASSPALRRRFVREGELARQLTDPGIVRVLDAGEDDQGPFLVMELVEGETLRGLLQRERRLELPAARGILTPLARALDHAHAAGIVHRDVKPENVFVRGWQVKLGDFGNARVTALASVTGASLTWGTPEYAAPELFSRGRADPRSDLYALGVMIYELLTGRLPWTRVQALGRMTSRSAASLPPTGAGDQVDRLLADLLAPSPSDRPASGAEVLARLDAPAGVGRPALGACAQCGAPQPDDLPICFACHHETLRLTRGGGHWMVVLRRLDDDVAAVDRLLRVTAALREPMDRPIHFLTGSVAAYSEEELKEVVDFPATLFGGLTEADARKLAAFLRDHGFQVDATDRIDGSMPAGKARRHWLAAIPVCIWLSAAVPVVGPWA